jgi:hypothetical protein
MVGRPAPTLAKVLVVVIMLSLASCSAAAPVLFASQEI